MFLKKNGGCIFAFCVLVSFESMKKILDNH